jgi:hypothetical protein
MNPYMPGGHSCPELRAIARRWLSGCRLGVASQTQRPLACDTKRLICKGFCCDSASLRIRWACPVGTRQRQPAESRESRDRRKRTGCLEALTKPLGKSLNKFQRSPGQPSARRGFFVSPSPVLHTRAGATRAPLGREPGVLPGHALPTWPCQPSNGTDARWVDVTGSFATLRMKLALRARTGSPAAAQQRNESRTTS